MEILTRISIWLFVVVVILLAITIGSIRLAISNIEYFKPEIEYLLKRDVSKDIVFSGVSGAMNRLNPILRIENVSINLPDRSQPVFIDRLAVEFDFWASLREQAPVALEVSGQLEKLELTKDKSGRWWSHELELAAGNDQTVMPEFVRALALVPRYLKLDLRRLIIQDQKTGTTHQLESVDVHVDHQGDQFFSRLSAALPDQLGQGLLVKSVVGRDRSVFYVNASNLQLAELARLFDVNTGGVTEAALDGEVWVNMAGYHVLAINGNLALKQGLLQVSADKTPVRLDYHARFNAINRKSSWSVTSDVGRLKIDGKNVLGFRTQIEIGATPEQTLISAWINRMQISSLPVVAGQWLPATLNKQIAQSKVEGLLRDVMFSIDLERPGEFKIAARATEVRSEAFGNYPGITNLNADLLVGNNKLGARIHGESIRLDFGDQFKAPLELDELELNANATRHESGEIVLSVDEIQAHNQDAKISGRMWLETEQDEPPFMFLRADFSDANAGNASKYLPVKLVPKKTQEWLDRGIISGISPGGDLQFHGRLRDIREFASDYSGEFFVDFNVEQAEVFFAPGWLHAKNGAGRVLFHNTGVEFDLDRVSYENLDNARARGAIANFHEAVLELDIKSEVPTVDAVRIWIDTPVGARFRKQVSNLHDLGGDVRTEIKIQLPLSENEEPQVRVDLDFDNARVQAQNWGLELSQINGRLQVTQDTIVGNEISASFFGDPVEIEINTDKSDGNTLVEVYGLLESRNLLTLLPNAWTRNINGKSDWQVKLDIAADSAPAEQPYLRINATSNLKATGIELPRPLAKPGNDSTRISTALKFFPDHILFEADLGADMRSRGQVSLNSNQDFELNSLELAFSSELKAKPQNGLHLYGTIPDITVEEWVSFLNSTGTTNPALLESVELELDRVHAYNRTLESVDFDLQQTGEKFHGSIESSLVRGKIEAPRQPSAQNPVIIDLEYLRLDKLEQEEDYSKFVPSDLWDFRLSSQALVFHEMLFNDLLIEARHVENTLYIDDFTMRRDEVILTSTGKWEYNASDHSHLSSLSATIKGAEFGQAIAGIGFGDSISGGVIDFNGSFTWPAPLLSFELESLVADAKLKLENGVLNNVEPGSGRFVGLLSLSALPRRLSLDFSDVVVEGMEFDKITGTYRVEGGVLYTRNTKMDGPAAKIKIRGKTGITNRDYDQEIGVTPKIRQTLPLIGAISAGSTIGWGLLLLQNLFKKAIDDAVEIEYKVTGSWDDPQIELIKAVDENQQELPNFDK